MDKKYLEEQMSAYLDGEMPPGEMSKYEQEIKAYPDLFAELQTLQRLNKLAGGSKLAMPDDRYFENLAGRIDAKIKIESTEQRSRIIDFFVERRKTIAVISSVAAVLLVTLISMNLFGPSARRYPTELPTQENAPAKIIDQSPNLDSAATELEATVTQERTATPHDESLHQKTANEVSSKEPEEASGTTATQSALTSPDVSISPSTLKFEAAESKNSKTDSRELPPNIRIRKGELNKQTLSADSPREIISDAMLSESTEEGRQLSKAAEADTVVIITETIMPAPTEAYSAAPAIPKSEAGNPDTAQLQGSSGLSWNVYLRVFRELELGMYSGWKLSAPSRALDSLRAWKDSLNTLGPARWYAEQAFRSLQTRQMTWEEYQRMRAYIDHYMAESQIPDSALWNRRLPIVNDIYERQIGKQYREKR